MSESVLKMWCKSCGEGIEVPPEAEDSKILLAHINDAHGGSWGSHPGFTSDQDEALEASSKEYATEMITVEDVLDDLPAERVGDTEVLGASLNTNGDLMVSIRSSLPEPDQGTDEVGVDTLEKRTDS